MHNCTKLKEETIMLISVGKSSFARFVYLFIYFCGVNSPA